MSGLSSCREIPVSASASITRLNGTWPRLRQFSTTLGLSMLKALAALEGPPRTSITRSTGRESVLMLHFYHAA